MSFPTEQLRLYVLTRHKAGAATNDIIGEMVQVHGKSNVPTPDTIYRWIRDIKNGCFELSKGKTTGRPRTTRTPALVARVKDSVEKNPRQSVRTIAYEMGVPYVVVYAILKEDLQLQKLCSTWVPAELTDEHKRLRIKACRGILKHVTLANIHEYVIQDETWVGWDVSLTKAQLLGRKTHAILYNNIQLITVQH